MNPGKRDKDQAMGAECARRAGCPNCKGITRTHGKCPICQQAFPIEHLQHHIAATCGGPQRKR